ncbi:YhjD/YihY/BrkB family envelope integrity protein [Metamycoplasma auris]|uniref:Membrane protein n=1 Tax=Metamycoplasma auris TaxID=51363 RepID=A0A2W7G1X4_9BACT|nr:YhjD/YihY/BrkB family envelope integrity protein [Metamycoplasma auris]PZW00602.1 membrane protein [Metamycoplasma auris]
MKKKNRDYLQTGWDKEPDNQEEEKKQDTRQSKNFSSKHIVKNKKRNNIIEKIIKSIIYGILFIAMPNSLRSSRSKAKEIVNTTYLKINSYEFAFVPAGFAMYMFLSFIPTIGLVIGIIGLINKDYETIIKVIILGQLIPGIDKVIPAFSGILNNAGGAITFIILSLSVLWLSSKGYSKFILSIDALYGHKTTNALWKTRVKGFLTSIIITISLTIFLLTYSAFLAFILENVFKQKVSSIKGLIDLRWDFQIIFWLPIILFLPMLIYCSLLISFKFSPSFKIKFSQISPGVLIATIPTSLYILIFGSLASLINYKQFGIVASFMYIILLLSIMSYFIYTGVIVNASFYKTFINLPTIEKGRWLNKRN